MLSSRLIKLLVLLLISTPVFAIVPLQMLSDIDYVPSRNGQLMAEIQFGVPIRYVSHFPIERTKQIEIHLLIRNLSAADRMALPLEETRFVPKKSYFPIEEIMYDGYNKDDPILIVKFKQPIDFRVGQTKQNVLQITFPSIALAPSASPALAARIKKQDKDELQKRRQLEQRKIDRENRRIAERAKTRKKLKSKNKKSIVVNKRTEAKVAKLMSRGRDALTKKDNRKAINIFTSVLSLKQHSYTAEAQELLGVARERNGQIAHAKKVYKDYLVMYPEGEGNSRVQQRLTDLVSNAMLPKGKLKKAKSIGSKGFKKDVFGSFSVYSFTGQNDVGGITSEQQTLQSYLNLTGRFRSPRFDIRSFIYGVASGHFNENETEYEVEANSLYFDIKDSKLGYTLKLGRQSGNTGGIFGRFDGAKLAYELHKKFTINGIAGYSVNFSEKDRIQTNMPFVSASMNVGSFFKYLDFAPYIFYQTVDGTLNRSAFGMETRYAHPRLNMFNVWDFDDYYQDFNIIMFYALFQATKNTKFNINIDHRKNPLLQTTTALINSSTFRQECDPTYVPVNGVIEPYNSVAQMVNDCGTNYYGQVLDLTGNSQTYTFGINHTFSKRFQINMDMTRAQSETFFEVLEDQDPINPNTFFRSVLEQENFNQFSYSTQFIFSRLFQKRDSTIFGFRYVDDEDYTGFNANFSNRLNFKRSLRLHTRFLLDRRNYLTGNVLTRYRPSLKVDYKLKRKMEFQAEVGIENSDHSDNQTASDSSGFFFTLGYRWDF